MAPPGRPNMTSVPSISRLLMSAWAPVICMVRPFGVFGEVRGAMKNPPQERRAGERSEAGASVRYGTTRMRLIPDTVLSLRRRQPIPASGGDPIGGDPAETLSADGRGGG